jgi:hypothetical protein
MNAMGHSRRFDGPPVNFWSFPTNRHREHRSAFLKGDKNRYNLLFAEWFDSVIITYVART